jgi:hypothetical protein
MVVGPLAEMEGIGFGFTTTFADPLIVAVHPNEEVATTV